MVNHTTTTNCYCISSAKVSSITATSYTTANSNPCVTDDVALYDVAATTSTFGTCYSLGNVKSTSYSTPYGATVSSADSCLTKCKSNTAAFFIPYTSGGSNLFGCLCSSEVTMYTAIGTTCGQNTWYRYGNTGATTSGSVLKRKSLAASKKDKIRSAREKGYACPPGMIACQVDTHSGAWEASPKYPTVKFQLTESAWMIRTTSCRAVAACMALSIRLSRVPWVSSESFWGGETVN